MEKKSRFTDSSPMKDKSDDRRPLPADIEAEILLRFPVKILKRFRCACKSWYSLISSPQFQKDHFGRAQTKPPLLLTLRWDLGDDLTLRFTAYNNNTKEGTLTLFNSYTKTLPVPYYFPFMQSCLGLVCLFQIQDTETTLLCNPSTQELIFLPPTQELNRSVGFGFAASTQEFKVVRVFDEEEMNQCDVFTLGASGWRPARTPPPYLVSLGTSPFHHGALHFLPEISSDTGVKDTGYIAVFDIDTEEYRAAIPLPLCYYNLGNCEGRGIMNVANFLRLTTLSGTLCLTFDYGLLKRLLDIWFLKDYNSANWVKGYTINISTVYPYTSDYFHAYPTETMGDDIWLSCYDDKGVKVLSYDPQDDFVKVKKDEEWAATFYTESFYPLTNQR